MNKNKVFCVAVLLLVLIITLSAVNSTDTTTDTQDDDNNIASANTAKSVSTDKTVENIKEKSIIKTTKNNNKKESTVTAEGYADLVSKVNSAKTSTEPVTISLQPGNYNATGLITWGGSSNKVLTIEGNGLVLDGKGTYQFMNIQSGNLVTLKNMTIQNYKAASRGGAIICMGQLNTDGVTFANNQVTGATAGAILFQSFDGKLSTVNNTIFSENYATSGPGGAISVQMANVLINNSQFIKNSGKSGYGGAINNMGTLTIENTLFDENKIENGGAIYTENKLVLNNVTFNNNEATRYGGAINYGNNYINITNSRFNNNKAQEKGGALYAGSGILNVEDTAFENNSAPEGGVVYTSGTTNITGSIFNLNNATTGAAIYSKGGSINLEENVFVNNTATNETLALPQATATFYENIYIETSVLYDEYTIALTSPKEEYLIGDEIEVTVTQSLTNPGYYDTYLQDDTFNEIFTNGKLRFVATSNPITILIEEYPEATEGVLNITAVNLINGKQTNNISVNVKEMTKPTVNVTNNTVTLSETTNITATFYEGYAPVTEGLAIFRVNGKTLRNDEGDVIYVPIIDGIATLNNVEITSEWMSPDTTIQAISTGSENFDPIFTEKVAVNITKPEADIVLTAPTEAEVGETITLTATVTSNGENVTSGRVAFKFNGKTIKDESGKTLYFDVNNGVATTPYTIPAKTKAKTYTLTAVFTDTLYDRVESNSDIAILK